MSTLQNKPVALWFELKGGINLWSFLMRAQSSQCRIAKLSQWQYRGELIWSELQILYLLHLNLTTLQKQHWLNRDDGAMSFSTVYFGSFAALLCTASNDVPGLTISLGGTGQCCMAGVSRGDRLFSCFEFPSLMAVNPLPAGVAGSHLQHSSQTRLELISAEPKPPASPCGSAQQGLTPVALV